MNLICNCISEDLWSMKPCACMAIQINFRNQTAEHNCSILFSYFKFISKIIVNITHSGTSVLLYWLTTIFFLVSASWMLSWKHHIIYKTLQKITNITQQSSQPNAYSLHVRKKRWIINKYNNNYINNYKWIVSLGGCKQTCRTGRLELHCHKCSFCRCGFAFNLLQVSTYWTHSCSP